MFDETVNPSPAFFVIPC